MNTIEIFYRNIGKFCFDNSRLDFEFFKYDNSKNRNIFIFEVNRLKIRVIGIEKDSDKITIELDIELDDNIERGHMRGEYKFIRELNHIDKESIKLVLPILIDLENNIDSFIIHSTYLSKNFNITPTHVNEIDRKKVDINLINNKIKKYKMENKLKERSE
jgi:hypothetical protein